MNIHSLLSRRTITICIVALLLATTAYAQMPKIIAYQGILTDVSGNPKPDGPYTVSFNIYTVPTGGAAIWSQASVGVTTQKGLFSYILGSGTPFPATMDFSVQYYLGVTVSPDPEIAPRVQLTAAPYSMRAATVDYGVPVGAVVPFFGTVAPAGWLLCNGASVATATYPELFAIMGYACGGGGPNFNLPDTRGRFLRGVDGGAGNDPDAGTRLVSASGGNAGNAVGSLQTNQVQAHGHGVNDLGHGHSITDPGHFHGPSTITSVNGGSAGAGLASPPFTGFSVSQVITGNSGTGIAINNNVTGISIQTTGGNETRPVNLYVNYIIKAKP